MQKILIFFLIYESYSIQYQPNKKIFQIQPKNTYNVQKYISNNKLSPYILYTVINNCCRCIMIYHNFYDKFHGNTKLEKFYMYENYECILLDNNVNNNTNTNYTLNKYKRYKDYFIFFCSCNKELTNYNLYFFRIFNKYKITTINSLFNCKK